MLRLNIRANVRGCIKVFEQRQLCNLKHIGLLLKLKVSIHRASTFHPSIYASILSSIHPLIRPTPQQLFDLPAGLSCSELVNNVQCCLAVGVSHCGINTALSKRKSIQWVEMSYISFNSCRHEIGFSQHIVLVRSWTRKPQMYKLPLVKLNFILKIPYYVFLLPDICLVLLRRLNFPNWNQWNLILSYLIFSCNYYPFSHVIIITMMCL